MPTHQACYNVACRGECYIIREKQHLYKRIISARIIVIVAHVDTDENYKT